MHLNSTMVFSPGRFWQIASHFSPKDWGDIYRKVSESMLPRMPIALGLPVKLTMYTDAAHAENLINWRSHLGIFIFVNKILIHFYSKQQNTVKASTFGLEIVPFK